MARNKSFEKSCEERRVRANFRERKRVDKLNGVFKALLHLLPPALFETRLSRVQILREAMEYIRKMTDFLKTEGDDPTKQFPHLFDNSRNHNQKIAYRKVPINNGNNSSRNPEIVTVYHPTHTLISTPIDANTKFYPREEVPYSVTHY